MPEQPAMERDKERVAGPIINRREFLQVSGLAFASVLAGEGRIEAGSPTAELVLAKGNILTIDGNDSIAEAVAVKDGRILDVGKEEAIRRYIGPGTQVVDLRGRTVTPGLIDSHAHLPVFGLRENGSWVNLQSKESKEEILDAISARARQFPAGSWVYAWGIRDLTLSFLDRHDLDRISRDHPILAVQTGGQWGFANTLALKRSRIDGNTPDPAGAKIGKDDGGNPTGLLLHYPALYLARKEMPVPTKEQYGEALRFAANLYAAEGVTTVHDNFFFIAEISSGNAAGAYLENLESNRIPIRVKLWPYIPNLQEAHLAVKELYSKKDPDPKSDYGGLSIRKKENPSFFRNIWGGWKLAADGGGPSALFYRNRSALPLHSEKDFTEMVSLFHGTGQQICVHAVGDKAVDLTLSAFIQANKKEPRKDHRHRLEHALSPTVRALDVIAKSGTVVSTHPQWIYRFFDNSRYLKVLDRERGVVPLKSILQRGIPVAFGADPPAYPLYQPQVALWQASVRITEKGHQFDLSESIPLEKALRCQTMGSAYSAFQEREIGSVEKGKLADLVVWNRDIRGIEAGEIMSLKPEATMVGGKVIFGKL